jgi:predicted ATPase
MLRDLTVEGFKRFLDAVDLSFAPLTILAGVNGGGKSSALQPLLLVHQELIERGPTCASLALNGPLLTLGTAREVMNRRFEKRAIAFRMKFDDDSIAWRCWDGGDRGSQSLTLVETTYETGGRPLARSKKAIFPPAFRKGSGEQIVRALENLRYVPADRLGPASTYPLLDGPKHRTLGPRADRAVGALRADERPVDVALRHPKLAKDERLMRQVETWLGELFPEIVLEVLPVRGNDLATLRIRTSPTGDFDVPHNAGFGISYVLPVIVALIGAHPGEIVVLENPEAHLHPHAQAVLGRICARVASAGVQVIVETHCDHLLNGIRVAARHGQIQRDKVVIHFFGPPSAGGRPSVHLVKLGPGERYTPRPEWFFDETERQLQELVG